MLISIVLSLLAILACLSLFLNHDRSATELGESSEYNSQLNQALVIMQKEVLDAGYRIEGATTENMVINVEAATATTPASTSLLWRYRNDAAVLVCVGFRESTQTLDGRNYRSLSYITSTTDCDIASALETLAWDTTASVLGYWRISDELTAYLNTNAGNLFTFTEISVPCSPFGIMPESPRKQITISAPTFAELNGNTSIPAATVSSCAVNLT